MLPSFRVRQILPLESTSSEIAVVTKPYGKVLPGGLKYTDGIIRMRKEKYEELVKAQPKAALRYLDEDDGEIILVGSALELEQRLQEVRRPLFEHTEAGIQSTSQTGLTMHSFDVEREQEIIDMWRGIYDRSKRSNVGSTTSRLHEDVSFGRTSPLTRNAPRRSMSQSNNNVHARRWASYSNLPASFDQNLAELPDLRAEEDSDRLKGGMGDTNPQESSPEELRLAAYNASSRLPTDQAAGPPVFSSTMQVSSSQKQEKEYKPLLELFETQLAELASPSSSKVKDTLEKDVSESKAASHASTADSPFAFTQSQYDHSTQCNLFTVPSTRTSEASPALLATSSLQVRRDAPTDVLRSLLANVGTFAGSYTSSIPNLQDHIHRAKQTFVGEIGKAVKETLRPLDVEVNPLSTVEALLGTSLDSAPAKSYAKLLPTSTSSSTQQLPVCTESAQMQAVLQHLQSQEVEFRKYSRDQKQAFENHLEKQVDVFSAYIANQKTWCESFLRGRTSLLPQAQDLSEYGPKTAAPVEISQDSQGASALAETKTQQMTIPSQNSSFQSLTDSALNEFDFDAWLKHHDTKSSTALGTNLIDVSTKPHATATDSKAVQAPPFIPRWEDRRPRSIVARRLIYYDGFRRRPFEQFLVRWEGCGADSDTWCDRTALPMEPDAISKFGATAAKVQDKSHSAPEDKKLLAEWHSRGTANDLLNGSDKSEQKYDTANSDIHGNQACYSRGARFASSAVRSTDENITQAAGMVARDAGPKTQVESVETAQAGSGTMELPLRNVEPSLLDQPELGTSKVIGETTITTGIDLLGRSLTAEEQEEGEAWDTFSAKYFNKPKVMASHGPQGAERPLRHRQSWHPCSTTSAFEKPPFEFSPTAVMKHIHPVSENTKSIRGSKSQKFNTVGIIHRTGGHYQRTNSQPLWKQDSQRVPPESVQAKSDDSKPELDAKTLGRAQLLPLPSNQYSQKSSEKHAVNDTAKPEAGPCDSETGLLLLPPLPVEPKVSQEPTLWQASCLFDGSLNSRNPQTHYLPQHPSSLTKQNLDNLVSKEDDKLTSFISAYDDVIGSRSLIAPSIPPKPARLQQMPKHELYPSVPPCSMPIPLRTGVSALQEPRPWHTAAHSTGAHAATRLAGHKRFTESDLSHTTPSLLEGNDVESTLDSLLFPTVVRNAQTQERPSNMMAAHTAMLKDHARKPSELRETQETNPSHIDPMPPRISVSNTGLVQNPVSFPDPHVTSLAPTQAGTHVSAATPSNPATASSSTHKFSLLTTPTAKRCATQLIEMGFPSDKAELVSVSVSGDLEKAIEVFEEDQKLWRSQMKGKGKAGGGWEAAGRGRGQGKGKGEESVPGSWDDELYG